MILKELKELIKDAPDDAEILLSFFDEDDDIENAELDRVEVFGDRINLISDAT